MRRHAKAASSGSTMRQAGRLGRILGGTFAALGSSSDANRSSAPFFGIVLLAALVGALVASASAAAATVTERPLLFTFNGTADAGPLTVPHGIAVDNATGDVYITNAGEEGGGGGRRFLSKFTAAGVPSNFSSNGSSSLAIDGDLFSGFVAVDNSGGSSQGRILVAQSKDIISLAPSGALQWTLPETDGEKRDVTVDPTGHPWTNLGNQYANTGSPPSKIFSLGASSTWAVDVDANQNVYLANGFGAPVRKYVGGAFTSNLDSSARDVYADQSSATGHIFTVDASSFTEFDSAGAEVGTYGANYIGNANYIAYNPNLDWVYVLQGNVFQTSEGRNPKVAVFGPLQTGTVPDVSIEPPSSIGVSSAHFSGKVNPQGTSSEWVFQWRKPGKPWDEAAASPAQSLPADSSDHVVEYTSNSLRGNTEYEVRLVASNAASHLSGFSEAKSFKTVQASEVPEVSIAAPGTITTSSAKITGAVNPKGDTADWRVQLSTDPSCAAGYSDQALQSIEPASNSPVGVEYEVTGLLPSEHYCARLVATNSKGSTTSEAKEFTTKEIPATDVVTGFVAPRLATSARLNGYVNPQGSAADYTFEYSDDGSTWTALPSLQTERARDQIVVSQELSGLLPDTSYQYRLTVENQAGAATGAVKAFTTRSAQEVEPPGRGYEMVSNPDKGNQAVRGKFTWMGDPTVSLDGTKALWTVNGGAPGSPSGIESTFLSERTPSGWVSRSVTPPAQQQVGGGLFFYLLRSASADLSKFLFLATDGDGFFSEGKSSTFVKLDPNQNQEVLASYETSLGARNIDATTDYSHVLLIRSTDKQVVDIGSGAEEVVSIMPDGTQAECGVPGNGGFVGAPETGTGQAAALQWEPGYHMVATTDASRVYFEARPNGSCGESTHLGLYVRNRTTSSTLLIDPGSTHNVEFIRATPDGHRAFFVTQSRLESADHNDARDIYEWNEELGISRCLTCVVAEAGVDDAVVISDDFSTIYFESAKQLISGMGSAAGPIPNLYALSSSGALHFVARAAAELSNAVTSDNGGELLFLESHPGGKNVTTSDKISTFCSGIGPGVCRQLFLYDRESESVDCVSCVQGGVTNQQVGTTNGASYVLSSDGKVAAFTTYEGIVPSDVNNSPDVYEWRNGVVRLITNGLTEFPDQSSQPGITGIDKDGRTIFYTAPEPGLTGYEQDRLPYMYAARVGGGFPRPVPLTHCSEESCQGQLQAPPTERESGSGSLPGDGNLKSASRKARCGKGRVRRRGRCVRKRHAHAHARHAARNSVNQRRSK